MRKALFDQILSGEDPELVVQLEEIPEFVDVQSRYCQMYAAWRYQDGENWTALTDAESTAIARALLQGTLSKQDPSYAQHEDYEETLQKLIVPLKSALQDVFPPFELAMYGILRLKMDVAAALIHGTTMAASLLCTVIFCALVYILCQGKYSRRKVFAWALIPAAVICLLLAVSFFTDKLALSDPSPLMLLRDLPTRCAVLLLLSFLLCMAGGITLLFTAKKYRTSVEEALQMTQEDDDDWKEAEAPVQAPVTQTVQEPASTFIPSPFAAEAPAPVQEAESATQSEPDNFTPLFSGASSYDVDVQTPSGADMDALLAEATGDLFSALPMGDPAANAEFLEDLQGLFEGRVDNG